MSSTTAKVLPGTPLKPPTGLTSASLEGVIGVGANGLWIVPHCPAVSLEKKSFRAVCAQPLKSVPSTEWPV